MKLLTLVIVGVAIMNVACEDPAANKSRATTAQPSVNTTANVSNSAPVAAKGDVLPVTPENSKIEFVGSKVTGRHDGGFKAFSGTIDLVNGKAEESTVSVEIDMNSVFSDNADLTEHLKSPDFFDVAKFQKATFTSTKIVADTAKGANNFNVTGDLTLHGVTKSVTFPATININETEVAVNADFAINRKEFAIVYAGMADDLIRDDVALKLELKAPRKN
ncbi:YceI family protein [soil metagenome]